MAPDPMLLGPGEQAWHVNKAMSILLTWPRWLNVHPLAWFCNSSTIRKNIAICPHWPPTQLCPKTDIIWNISMGRLWTDFACLRLPGNLRICSAVTYCAHTMEQHSVMDRGWDLKSVWLHLYQFSAVWSWGIHLASFSSISASVKSLWYLTYSIHSMDTQEKKTQLSPRCWNNWK